MMAFLLVMVLWVIPIILGAALGSQKGRAGLGVALGIFLGWIGVGIIAVISPTLEARRATALSQGFACPFCQEPVRQGATVCPHCQRDVPPSAIS